MPSLYKSTDRPGTIKDYGGGKVPPNHLLMAGQSLLVAQYPSLFNIFGYRYGGAGANFNLPDGQGVGIIGEGTGTYSGATAHALTDGITGEEGHVLIESELPSHNHTIGNNNQNHTHTFSHTHNNNSHYHQYQTPNFQNAGGGGETLVYRTGSNQTTFNQSVVTTSGTFNNTNPWNQGATGAGAGATHTHSGQDRGGSGAHNNIQPSLVVKYMIRF